MSALPSRGRAALFITALLLLPSALALSGPLQPGEGGMVARYHELGLEMQRAGEVEKARAHFERVLEREAGHLPTLYALVQLKDEAATRTDEQSARMKRMRKSLI